MKIFGHTFRFLIAALLFVLPLAGITRAAAQEQEFTPELYTSTLSGYEIEVSGPEFEIISAEMEHYSNGDGEIVRIQGQLATLEVSFFDDGDTPDESIDAYLSGLEGSGAEIEVADRGITGDTSYAIVNVLYEGLDVLYYVQVTQDVTGNVDLFEAILTTAETFELDLETAQEEVLVDGVPFMADVDAAGVAATAEAGNEGDATASPEADTTATVVTFPNADVDLSIGGEFDPVPEVVSAEGIDGFVVTGPDTATMVALGETDTSAADIVAQFAGGLEGTYEDVNRIGFDDSGDTAWSLFSVLENGEPKLAFVYSSTVAVPGYELLVAVEMPQTDVAESIESVQDGLALNGEPLLADVDPMEISGLAGESGESEAETPTETATETATATEETESGSDSPRENAKIPAESGSGNSSETSPTEEAESTPEASGESGELIPYQWTGPVLGHRVEWNGAIWTSDINDPEMVISDEAEQFESIALVNDSTSETSILYVDAYGQSDITPAEYLAYWTSDEYLMRETANGEPWNAEVVATRSNEGRVAVVVSYSSGDGNYLMIREAVATEDGGVLLLTLDAPAAEIGDAYAATRDNVYVDGDQVFAVFTQDQIERLSGE